MTKLVEIQSAIMQLPPEVRAELRDWMLDNVPFKFDSSVEEAWADETKRRLDDLDSGRTRAVSSEDVFARARKILGK
jgi:putative addiction module component (TIGR02574 family)